MKLVSLELHFLVMATWLNINQLYLIVVNFCIVGCLVYRSVGCLLLYFDIVHSLIERVASGTGGFMPLCVSKVHSRLLPQFRKFLCMRQ